MKLSKTPTRAGPVKTLTWNLQSAPPLQKTKRGFCGRGDFDQWESPFRSEDDLKWGPTQRSDAHKTP